MTTRVGRPLAHIAVIPLLLFGAWAHAQDKAAAAPPPAQDPGSGSESETAALAKAAQNPIASMISLPFQYNMNIGVERYEADWDALFLRRFLEGSSESQGPDGTLRERARSGLLKEALPGLEKHDRNQHILNIQPVIPVSMGKVNLINRFILPLMYQPTGEDDGEFGLGDLQYMMFFSPADAGKVIWGVGPTFMIPTATDDVLGTGKWCAGPSFVVLIMPGHWVLGALANNLWSFAGESDRPDVNTLMIQPFINYNFTKGWYAASSPIITANWEAESGDRWTIPVGGGFGKVFKVGKQPMNARLGAYYNLEKPDGGADWNIRFELMFMFPK